MVFIYMHYKKWNRPIWIIISFSVVRLFTSLYFSLCSKCITHKTLKVISKITYKQNGQSSHLLSMGLKAWVEHYENQPTFVIVFKKRNLGKKPVPNQDTSQARRVKWGQHSARLESAPLFSTSRVIGLIVGILITFRHFVNFFYSYRGWNFLPTKTFSSFDSSKNQTGPWRRQLKGLMFILQCFQ